jgi:HAD superfamily hydrolase (TIGR01662 family)
MKEKSEKKFSFFNRDHTLIKSTSGTLFPQETERWEFHKNVKEIVSKMLENDFHIVITTNQPGIKKGTTTKKVQETICNNIINSFNENCRDKFRYFIGEDSESEKFKPNKAILKDILKDDEIDIINSIVIGDTKTDVIFAKNINLLFKPAYKFFKQDQILTVMTGFPACGKSHHIREFHPFDVRVCLGDIICSMNEEYKIEWKNIYYNIEEKLIIDSLSNKLNIVIDRTNIDKNRRKRFIDLVNKFKRQREEHTHKPENIKIICKYFRIPIETCKENYRNIKKISEDKLWQMEEIFDRMESEFEEPTLDEGFDEIIHILPQDLF